MLPTIPPVDRGTIRTDAHGLPMKPQRSLEECDYHYGGRMVVDVVRPESKSVGNRPPAWRRARTEFQQGKADGVNAHHRARLEKTAQESSRLPKAYLQQKSTQKIDHNHKAREEWAASAVSGRGLVMPASPRMSSPRGTRQQARMMVAGTTSHEYGAFIGEVSPYGEGLASRYMTGKLGTRRHREALR